jgi:hypothetical protein
LKKRNKGIGQKYFKKQVTAVKGFIKLAPLQRDTGSFR